MSARADLKWWLELAPSLDWTFARTMKDHPHSYVVRGKTLADPDFERAVRVIRTFGIPGNFYGKVNVYLIDEKVTGKRWWTMGDTLAGTIIINQAPWDQVYGKQTAPSTYSGLDVFYDQLAPDYDARFTSEACQAENKAVRSVIAQHAGAYAPKLLDIGCGTGLLLDMGVTHHSLYAGVDPSQAMLNELIRKHPKVTRLFPGRWEQMASRVGQGYDVIASTFGGPSYIEPRFIGSIPRLANSTGITVLMPYVRGYVPDYDQSVPDWADESRAACEALPGARVFELGKYRVVTVKRD